MSLDSSQPQLHPPSSSDPDILPFEFGDQDFHHPPPLPTLPFGVLEDQSQQSPDPDIPTVPVPPTRASSSNLQSHLVANSASITSAPKRPATMPPYTSKVKIMDKYHVLGFISSGTYGRVFKAKSKIPGNDELFAIKKFKPDKENEVVQYTGISQSAIREMSLCSELSHPSLITLVEIILEEKCIFMVFLYAEHDLLQIIHYHSSQSHSSSSSSSRHSSPLPIPTSTLKSLLWQLLNGVSYLHTNWVLHRDLKPANIMVTSAGRVKIGDLGLARLFHKPLQPLFNGDKVVVTIWYRAPELLLGSRHYSPAIDLWAVGCIFAELLALRPIFKGEEAKVEGGTRGGGDNNPGGAAKKGSGQVPFQRNQMQRIVDVLGLPTREAWPNLPVHPEYANLATLKASASQGNQLEQWYHNVTSPHGPVNSEGFNLLAALLTYDPQKRLTAAGALAHPYFSENGGGTSEGPRDKGDGKTYAWSMDAFEGQGFEYPHRRVTQEDNDIRTSSVPNTKRTGMDEHSGMPPRKRMKE